MLASIIHNLEDLFTTSTANRDPRQISWHYQTRIDSPQLAEMHRRVFDLNSQFLLERRKTTRLHVTYQSGNILPTHISMAYHRSESNNVFYFSFGDPCPSDPISALQISTFDCELYQGWGLQVRYRLGKPNLETFLVRKFHISMFNRPSTHTHTSLNVPPPPPPPPRSLPRNRALSQFINR